MSSTLLTHLPDILNHATRRCREAIAAEAVPSDVAGHAPEPLPLSAAPQCRAGRDLSVLLEALTGTERHCGLKGRVGLLWMTALCPDASVEAGGWSGTQGAQRGAWSSDASPGLAQDRQALSHLALRLLLARDLMADYATVAVTPAPNLEDCIAFLMEAIFGQRPQRLPWKAAASGAPPLWVCRSIPQAAEVVSLGPGSGRPASTLAEWVRQEQVTRSSHGLTALALRPGRLVLNLMGAWTGPWVLSHSDPLALAVLAELVQQQALNHGVPLPLLAKEPVAPWVWGRASQRQEIRPMSTR